MLEAGAEGAIISFPDEAAKYATSHAASASAKPARARSDAANLGRVVEAPT
jgi:hypothetical protein